MLNMCMYTNNKKACKLQSHTVGLNEHVYYIRVSCWLREGFFYGMCKAPLSWQRWFDINNSKKLHAQVETIATTNHFYVSHYCMFCIFILSS